MNVKYKKLIKKLNNKKLIIDDLRREIRISSSSINAIKNNEIIGDSVIEKICNYLKCNVSEIMELNYEDEIKNNVNKRKKDKYRVISLFSGAGGMELVII